MSKLSEKDLLLLSNYLYLDKSTEYSTIGEMLDDCRSENGWIDERKVQGLGIGGCMSATECRKLLQELDNAPDNLKEMRLVRTIDEPELRAACFEDPASPGTAAVVFRGTGGTYEAWADNVRGEYMKDTVIQKMADDFVRYDCSIYDDITVTGHSKGGNLAGYVTVTNRDRVRSCLAFDPQGYGRECLNAYGQKMKDSSYNIKIVSAHNDYVNSLLTQIAKEKVYVKNTRSDAVGRHSSFALLEACDFDDDGNIINATAHKEFAMKQLSRLTLCTTAMMNLLPGEGNEKVSELLAAIAAGALGNDVDGDYKKERLREALAGLSAYCLDTMGLSGNSDIKVATVSDSIYADTAGIRSAASLIADMQKELSEVILEITDVRYNINYRAASRLAVETRLKILETRLNDEAVRLGDYSTCLEEIAGLIEGCESDLAGRMMTGSTAAA